jgi:parallel beta-helix repeat protein
VGIRVFVAAGAGAALLVGSAGVSAAAADVGATAETSGTLVLTQSATLAADHYGNIVIQADGVTLDCAGHTVYGPGLESHSGGIDIAFADDVTVTRCVVSGFVHNGLFGHHGANLRLDGNTFVGNGNHGVHLDAVSDAAVVGNNLRGNGTVDPACGIVLTRSANAVVTNNTTYGNPWAGIALFEGTTQASVMSNIATRNGTGFIVQDSSANALTTNIANRNTDGFAVLHSSGSVLSGNTANLNTGKGFSLDRGSSASVVSGNTAIRNQDGFNVRASNSNVLIGNVATANRKYGFVAFAGASRNTFSYNTALRSGHKDAWEEGSGKGDVWSGNRFRTTFGI